MTNEADPKRAAYEAALRGVVDAMHRLAEAFEAATIAGLAWDPEQTRNEPDPVQHATISSCRAIMTSIIERHAGAEQMFALDELVARAVRRAGAEIAAAQVLATAPAGGSA